MPFDTYSNLQAAIAGYLVDDSVTSANIVDAITLCESRIAYGASPRSPFPSPPLRIRAMEAALPLLVRAVQVAGTTAGSANAQTASLSGYTLTTGATVQLTIGSGLTNTAGVTLNIQSTGAKTVVQTPA